MHFNVLRERQILVAVRAKPSVHLLKRRLSASDPRSSCPRPPVSPLLLCEGNVEEKKLSCVRPSLVACTAQRFLCARAVVSFVWVWKKETSFRKLMMGLNMSPTKANKS